MKRFISLVLSAALLVSAAMFTAYAAGGKCVYVNATAGNNGYSAADDGINASVQSAGGGTIIFDFCPVSHTAPTGGVKSQLDVFFGGVNSIVTAAYDFTEEAFIIGEGPWVAGDQSSFVTSVRRDYALEAGTWYEFAVTFGDNEVTVYLDGVPMVCAEFDDVVTDYIICYPQFCSFYMDNIRVCAPDYDVTAKSGNVWAATDFDSASGVNSTGVWSFTDTAVFTLQNGGRACPTLEEILPTREINPEISGNYLYYSDTKGTGYVPGDVDFDEFGGFCIIEDIRFDTVKTNSHAAVRFGGSYIAGYDWDSHSFMISTTSGFAFNTMSYNIFAKVPYTLTVGETYELAIRRSGSTVYVYLDGVLKAQATNTSFAPPGKVYLSHYKTTCAIDNMTVAYGDYNVGKGIGGTVGSLTFDESRAEITEVWDFKFGTTYGYSIKNVSSVPSLTLPAVTAEDTTAEMTLSLANAPAYDGFVAEITYPSAVALTADKAARLSGTGVASPVGTAPYAYAFAANSQGGVTNGEVLKLTVNVPDVTASYNITVTLTPYIGDSEAEPLTVTGRLSYEHKSAPVVVSKVDGITYEDGVLSWNAYGDAVLYDFYFGSYNNEAWIDTTEDTYYEVDLYDYIRSNRDNYLQIVALDENYNALGSSIHFPVVVEDGTMYFGFEEYNAELLSRLEALAGEHEYRPSDYADVEAIISAAAEAFDEAVTLAEVREIYSEAVAEIADVPTSEVKIGDVNGDGIVNLSDNQMLQRYIAGMVVTVNERNADVNGDGFVSLTDLNLLTRHLAGYVVSEFSAS